MLTLFVLIPLCALFAVINVIIVCYFLIRLGYGPPNWQTALNLVVPLTTFQDCLNSGRDWIDSKAPWADKLLNRLHVPKPIVIVDTTPIEEEEPEENTQVPPETEQTDNVADEAVNDLLNDLETQLKNSPPHNKDNVP